MTDDEFLAHVEAIRDGAIARKQHPEDLVRQFMGDNAAQGQLRRLYGTPSVEQAARRATHGDCFRY